MPRTKKRPPDKGGAKEPRSDRAALRVLFSLALFLAVLGFPLYLFTLWHLTTRVVVDLVASRVVFTLREGKEPVPILPSPTSFRALTVEGFERVAFTPKRLEIFSHEPRVGVGRWIPVSSKGERVLRALGGNSASLSIEGVEPTQDPVGRFEALSAQPGSIVTMQISHASPPAMTLKIEGYSLSPSIFPAGRFELFAQHAELEGLAPPFVGGQPARLRVTLGANSPYLETVSRPGGLIVTITSADSSPIRLLEKSGAAIQSIDFTAQKSTGDLETTLTGPGQVTYTDYPKKKSVLLTEHDSLRLADLDDTFITNLMFDIQKQSLLMRIEGTVGRIFTKSGPLLTDYSATAFDRIIYNALLEYAVGFATLLGTMIVVWSKWHEILNIVVRTLRRRPE